MCTTGRRQNNKFTIYAARFRDRLAISTHSRFVSGTSYLVSALGDRVSAVACRHDDSHVRLHVREIVHLPVQRRVGSPYCPPAVGADAGADVVRGIQHLGLMARALSTFFYFGGKRYENERLLCRIDSCREKKMFPAGHQSS